MIKKTFSGSLEKEDCIYCDECKTIFTPKDYLDAEKVIDTTPPPICPICKKGDLVWVIDFMDQDLFLEGEN